MNTQQANTNPASRFSSSTLLWCSAFILAGLLIVQLSRLAPIFTPTAKADMVARVGEQSILTFDAGNEEAVAVLDARAEQMLIYRLKNRNSFDLVKVYSLPELFATADRYLGRSQRISR